MSRRALLAQTMALDDVRAKLSPSAMVNVAYAGQNRAAPGGGRRRR